MTWCLVLESRERTLQTALTNSRAGLFRTRWEPGRQGKTLLLAEAEEEEEESFSPSLLPRVWWIFWVMLNNDEEVSVITKSSVNYLSILSKYFHLASHYIFLTQIVSLLFLW